MKKTKTTYYIFILLIFVKTVTGQEWNFKLESKVELRNWKLSNKAMKNGTVVDKASVELRNTSGIISKTESDARGNFAINIPANGEFTLTLSYPGQNPKKFLVITKGVSNNNNDANFRPTINIAGMISIKHIKDMNYLGLDQARVTIESNSEKKNLIPRTTINDGEYKLIQKFCTANKLGDIALENKNYSLAKTFYSMATEMIGSEDYPKDQLKKAEEGLKIEKADDIRQKNKSKKNKAKTNAANKNIVAKPGKEADFKNSRETGKSNRKTLKTLGK